MFDDLLSQFEGVLEEARTLKGPKTTQSTADGLPCDPTKPFGAVTSFGKQQRFKAAVKEQLKTTHVEWHPVEPVRPAQSYSFQKIERFQTEKPKYNETYLNPSVAPTKKNSTNKVPIFKQPQVKDLAKSTVSVSTVASDSLRGPGVYNVREESRVRNGAFGKDGRFKPQRQTYEDTPLSVNESQTRRRPPTAAVMKGRTGKTQQLISREQQEALRERLSLVYWRSIPLELDRLLRNTRTAVIRQDYFNLGSLTGVHRRAALFMMLDRLNYLRGGYEQDIAAPLNAACAVAYRRSTPKPFKFSEMEPGPDYYYPSDDLQRQAAPAFSFARAGAVPKAPEGDLRDYEIREELFKRGGNIVINPEPKEHRLTEEEVKRLERGPGFYDCLFAQVERREGVGVVKFQEITEKNDRQNNCIEKREVNDGVYFPSYDAIDPNVPAPLYRAPAEKILFPEHWLFYDGDLNKVRAEIAKNVLLAKGMDFHQYQTYRDSFARFQQYLHLQKHSPEPAEYEVAYTAVDKHVPNVDMARQEEKTLIEPITKPEGHSPGDNLLLNPKPIEDHLPNIDWRKAEGRPDMEIDREGEPREGDRLVLNPTKPEKHVPAVDFKRQSERPEAAQSQESPEGDVLILEPRAVEKHLARVDMARQADRPQPRTEQDELQEVIAVELPEKKEAKGVAFSRLSSVRLVPHLRHQKDAEQ